MNMKKGIMLGLVALVAMTMTSCLSVNFGEHGKNGVDTTPTQVPQINVLTEMQPFDEVDITGEFKIIYEQGERHTVRIEASEQAFNEMTVYVKERELRIRSSVKKPTVSFKDVKVYVTSPNLSMVDLTGAGLFSANKPVTCSKGLTIDLTGSGKVLMVAAKCNEAHLDLTGSGTIELGALDASDTKLELTGSGDINVGDIKAGTVNFDLTGSGSMKLDKMVCNDFDIDLTGSGNVSCEDINADKGHTDVSGSGKVNLKGVVKNHTKETSGSGKVNITSPEAPAAIQ